MPTQTSDTRTFDDLFTTTAHNTRSQRYDNIFKTSAFWARLHANGRKVLEDGGARIERAIEYATNGTVKSHGDYETLDLTPQEHLTVAIDDWRQIAGTVSISRAEERKNSGRQRIINLVASKLRNLDMSFTEEMNKQAFALSIGNGGKDINPITTLVSKAATTVHNINESNNAYWANQRLTSASSSGESNSNTWQGHVSELNNFWNTCSKGTGGGPDLVVTTQLGYEIYEESLRDKVRYTSIGMGEMAFDSIRLRGADVVWDERCPRQADGDGALVAFDAGTADEHPMYFLNTNFLQLIVDSQSDFVTTGFTQSFDQLARNSKTLLMCQLFVTNRRKQGLLSGVNPAVITG